jgi:hypothetical protein
MCLLKLFVSNSMSFASINFIGGKACVIFCFFQSLCHVQNQIQELRKDTVKMRRSQALNLGQSNTNATDLSQVRVTQ